MADVKMKPASLEARQMDAEIAEKLMGWRVFYPYQQDGETDHSRPWYEPAETSTGTAMVPFFHLDIAAAWQVVEKLGLYVGPCGDGGWMASTASYWVEWETASADTAPLAICKVALAQVSGNEGAAG